MKSVSGKLVIIAIAALALSGAGVSWWVRYKATNQAAQFWGPAAVRLIHDASVVELLRFEPTPGGDEIEELGRFLDAPTNRRDISSLPGLTHLRHALLEDRSYIWPPRPATRDDPWKWILIFRDERSGALRVLLFSPDWESVTLYGIRERKSGALIFTRYEVLSPMVLSCKPIAEGLATMFADLSHGDSASR